jgi:phage recombination protein Bet
MASEEKPSTLRARFAARYGIAEVEVFDILKATAFKVKDGEASDAQLTALMIVADQYKLNPFTKEIYAYPDKQNGIVPVVSLDGWTRIINEHPAFDGIQFAYAPDMVANFEGLKKPLHEWVECVIYRKDRTHPIIIREYAEECYRPPFVGKSQFNNGGTYEVPGPWQSHPRRMLRHKSQIQCARIAFGFAGLYDEDEAARIIDMGAADEVPGAGRAADLMPRAITDDPTPTANFTTATRAPAAETVTTTQAATAKPATGATGQHTDPDFTAAPNRFDRPAGTRSAPARKTAAAARTSASPPPPDDGDATQAAMFEEPPAGNEPPPPADPVSPSMLNVLKRKLDIAGKTEVDLRAKWGFGLDGVTKANFGDVQKWASGQ